LPPCRLLEGLLEVLPSNLHLLYDAGRDLVLRGQVRHIAAQGSHGRFFTQRIDVRPHKAVHPVRQAFQIDIIG